MNYYVLEFSSLTDAVAQLNGRGVKIISAVPSPTANARYPMLQVLIECSFAVWQELCRAHIGTPLTR